MINSWDLKKIGGKWLAEARCWMQRKRNGDSVTWGSDEELRPFITVREVEDLASIVAAAAMNEQVEKEAVEKQTHNIFAALMNSKDRFKITVVPNNIIQIWEDSSVHPGYPQNHNILILQI